jgi:hypothetical protein
MLKKYFKRMNGLRGAFAPIPLFWKRRLAAKRFLPYPYRGNRKFHVYPKAERNLVSLTRQVRKLGFSDIFHGRDK